MSKRSLSDYDKTVLLRPGALPQAKQTKAFGLGAESQVTPRGNDLYTSTAELVADGEGAGGTAALSELTADLAEGASAAASATEGVAGSGGFTSTCGASTESLLAEGDCRGDAWVELCLGESLEERLPVPSSSLSSSSPSRATPDSP